MGFKIGNVEIKNKLVLAPMAGITNEAFRIICKELGAGLVVAEMLSDKAITFKNEKTLKMANVNPCEHPISMQIFGSDVESLVKAAKYIDEFTDADIIDINMGCPVNKVAKKSAAGASLLKDPNKVYEITKSVVEAVKKPVTVKIRIGWDFDSINAVENAILIEKAGAKAISVHGRTRSQFYSGKADYSVIRKVKESVGIPVIGNGDITDYLSAVKMFEETKCDAIMVGRAALGNPWIFKELDEYFTNNKVINKPSHEEIYNMIVYQHKMLQNLKGEHLANLEMRGHISWYLKGLIGSSRIKERVNKEKDFNESLKILKEYFNSLC